MASFSRQDTEFTARFPPSGLLVASTIGSDAATSPVERFLLFVTVMIQPLDSTILIIPNMSISFLMFGVLFAYVGICRLRCLDRIWMHPVFVAAYLFIAISSALEFASPLSSYSEIGRFTFMIGGALLVASICRDRAALKMLLYSYIGTALWVSVFLVLTSYGAVSGVKATNYDEASLARAEAFKNNPIVGVVGALPVSCVQGGIVALAFALTRRGGGSRTSFIAIGILCMVASSLPMARQAIVNALVSFGVMLKSYGIRQGRALLLTGLLATSGVLLIPDAIWSRMTVMAEEGTKEARVTMYELAFQHVDDYWSFGVGAGNFYQKWGFNNGFGRWNGAAYEVYGIHNSFLQLLIYWGILGLAAYLVIIWMAYRCLPPTSAQDGLLLGMLGIAVTFLMQLPFLHNFNEKGFSLGLGMLVAYQRWLKPQSRTGDSRSQD
jgi:hypothetical protein